MSLEEGTTQPFKSPTSNSVEATIEHCSEEKSTSKVVEYKEKEKEDAIVFMCVMGVQIIMWVLQEFCLWWKFWGIKVSLIYRCVYREWGSWFYMSCMRNGGSGWL